MSKRNPPILETSDPISSDEWQDIQQSVGAHGTQVKAKEKKKSKSSDTNSYAKDNQKTIKKLKG